VGGLVRHLPGDGQGGGHLQLFDVPVLRRKLAGEIKMLQRDGGHPELFQVGDPISLSKWGLLNERKRRSKSVA